MFSLNFLFRYLYCDECLVTDNNVFELMQAAKILQMGDLENKCAEFIEMKVNETNVSFFTGKALNLDAKESLNVCMDFFEKNTLKVLATQEFQDIPHEVLESYSDNVGDDCSESRFFVACFYWAKAECNRQNLEETKENFERVLGDNLSAAIRYKKTDAKESLITDANVFELMHAGKIFGMDELENDCSEFIQKKVTEANVSFFTGDALHFDAQDSLQVCLDFFKANTLKVLNTNQFLEVRQEVLKTFNENKGDRCSESRFFTACFNWAKAECKRRNLQETHENFREVLGEDLINDIKYDKMGLKEFLNTVVPTKVLTNEETGRNVQEIQGRMIQVGPFKFFWWRRWELHWFGCGMLCFHASF